MFLLYSQLASRPEIQKKCQDEIDRVLEKYNGELTYEALQDMNYLEAVCYGSIINQFII